MTKYYLSDEEEIKSFFEKKKPIIPLNKILDLKTIELLKKYGKSNTSSIFESFDKEQREYEICCERCKKVFIVKTSKAQLVSHISHLNKEKYYCENCKNILIKENNKTKEDDEREEKEYSLRYIDGLLDPNTTILKGEFYNVFKDLKSFSYNYSNIMCKKIKSLSYSDFLQTPYWKAIANQVRYRACRKCQLCGSDREINVHHKTYENHGLEINHIGDLICLCSACHNKFHKELNS
jgi:hypothetical protein